MSGSPVDDRQVTLVRPDAPASVGPRASSFPSDLCVQSHKRVRLLAGFFSTPFTRMCNAARVNATRRTRRRSAVGFCTLRSRCS
jgi:hypothetical protein